MWHLCKMTQRTKPRQQCNGDINQNLFMSWIVWLANAWHSSLTLIQVQQAVMIRKGMEKVDIPSLVLLIDKRNHVCYSSQLKFFFFFLCLSASCPLLAKENELFILTAPCVRCDCRCYGGIRSMNGSSTCHTVLLSNTQTFRIYYLLHSIPVISATVP